ncbi:DUF2240 family protein [Thermococcus sp.]
MSLVKSLRNAILYKGSNEFNKQELIGILVFTLKLMDVKSAKELIERGLKSGVIEERNGVLVINEELLEGEEKRECLRDEMASYIARVLGWSAEDVLEEAGKLRERYGELDEKILVYLFGMDKGIDMSRFKDRLEV